MTTAVSKRKIIKDGHAVCLVLGIDPMKVASDSLTLEPLGDGDWIVHWEGMAVLDRKAASVLFGEVQD